MIKHVIEFKNDIETFYLASVSLTGINLTNNPNHALLFGLEEDANETFEYCMKRLYWGKQYLVTVISVNFKEGKNE